MQRSVGRVLKALTVLCKCADQATNHVKDFTEMLGSLHALKVQQDNELKYLDEADKSDKLFAEARRLQGKGDPAHRMRRLEALNAWQNAMAHNRGGWSALRALLQTRTDTRC